jgi:dTDP-4-amino-4,6-dideoxygalactose transaminase
MRAQSTLMPNSNAQINMSSPDITQAEIDAVHDVLATRWLSIGPQIVRFEKTFANYTGNRHAIAVNSGTSGLHLAMIAAHVGEGDEVITSSFSFIASANCVLYERGKPVFVDVDPLTGNLDPEAVESAVTSRTRAIVPIHAFGQPADMGPILKIAQRYNLTVIEDACEAIGAEYQGRKVGTLSDAAVFAFYPNKQMTTGEGGMIVTDSKEWADLFCSLRNQGRDIFDAWLNHSRLGYNYRLDEMSAALGLVQLQRIEELLAKRERLAGWYHQRLAGEELIEVPYVAPTTTRMSWFVYIVRIKPPASRDVIIARLADQGIPSRPYFTPIHLQSFYKEKFGYRRGDLPVTERLGDVSLALPFSSVMTEDQVDYICSRLQQVLNCGSRGRDRKSGAYGVRRPELPLAN